MDVTTAGEALRLAELGHQPISLKSFTELSDRCDTVVERVRAVMLAPESRKKAPTFGTSQMTALHGLDTKQVQYRAKRGDLPSGHLVNRRLVFSLSDVRTWSKELRKNKMRPEGAEAITIVTANFKGGVTKTTTAVAMAQGLSLRGKRVLVLDLDPQASATTLLGFAPQIEIEEGDTVLPLCKGEQESIEHAIRPTYWEGVDLVPAMADLFAAEFQLPARQLRVRNFQFWNVLNSGIDNARFEYDVIIIDTPPSLSYLTINALMAADGLVMPLPPSALDFLSSSQFWGLVASLTQGLETHGASKTFDFVNILLSKVDPDDTAAPIVRNWITAAYGEKVLPVEIPLTASAGSAAVEFGTVYDQARKPATAAYDKLVDLIEDQVVAAWARQVAKTRS